MKKLHYYSTVKNKLTLLVLVITCAGCAHNQEFISKIKKEQWIYDDEYTESDVSRMDLTGVSKTGYVSPDMTANRIKFDSDFPVVIPKQDNIESIKSFRYKNRLGQVIRLSADLDKRTSGFIKDEFGVPMSVTGYIDVNPVSSVETAVISGASQAIAASSSSASLINPTQSAGYNVGAGLIAGFIAGAIVQVQIDTAIKGIISKEDFGSRMEETTFAAEAPKAYIMSKYGFLYGGDHIVQPNGTVKSIFTVLGKQDISRKTRIFILTTLGVYRGGKYKEKFPKTEGWEFMITNMNSIVVKEMEDPGKRLDEISTQLKLNKIQL